MLTIHDIVSSVAAGEFRLSASLSSDAPAGLSPVQSEVFFSLPAECRAFVQEDRGDALLLSVLYFAMHRGEDLHLDGAMSGQLLKVLNDDLIPLLRLYRPALHPIRVTARAIRHFPGGDATGTGFSGGVDSFFTVLENTASNIAPEEKVSILCCFNVGTHGLANSEEEKAATEAKFRQRVRTFEPAARQLGLPLIPVNSSVPSFLPDNILAAITLANAAAIYFLSGKIRHYLLASAGYNYRELFHFYRRQQQHPLHDLDTLAPLTLGLLSQPELQISSSGTELSRIEKCARIADHPVVGAHLNVCNSTAVIDRNCSNCLKCRRTMTDLEILGKLDRFSSVFDIDRYRREYKARDFAGVLHAADDEHFARQSCAYAMAHRIDLAGTASAMDLLCARLNGSWGYRKLLQYKLLDTVKHLLGRRR